ncbi:MAG: hypothetical protein P4N41_08125 [Negativicutes bacterium]|nr:hypothetical protein [Negativicutes bacterium]
MGNWKDDFQKGAETGFDQYGEFLETGDVYGSMKNVRDALKD